AGEQPYKKFCTHLNYISQDFAQYDGKGDGKGLHRGEFNAKNVDIISDITSIPLSDSSLDAILCTEVLEHVPNPIRALTEFQRLLKPGGWLILTAPFSSLTHFAPYHYSTGFSQYFYEKLLQDLNFEIIELVANGGYYDYLAQELNRLPFIVKRYSGMSMKIYDRLLIKFLLYRMNFFAQHDSGSNELLCFGYFVKARKL
ncbi:MAG: class I SAM-dependent methyltransferase, partial [Bacteroidales bacterium]